MRLRNSKDARLVSSTAATVASKSTNDKMGSTDFVKGASAELWIFDGLDDGAVPHEISLTHPRTGELCAFALGPKEGQAVIGEIRVFKSDKPSSFLSVVEGKRGDDIEDGGSDDIDLGTPKKSQERDERQGQVHAQRDLIVSNQELRFVSEIDPVFLLLPVLATPKNPSRSEGGKGVFLQFDDLMDQWREKDPHAMYLINEGTSFEGTPGVSTCMSSRLHAALSRCCDTVAAGDETMYRFSETRFFTLVLEKARKLVAAGLSPSLEDMAQRAVEPPYTAGSGSLTTARQQLHTDTDADSVGTAGPGAEQEDGSQASKADSVFSQPPTPVATSVTAGDKPRRAQDAASETALGLMRLRIALDLILGNYVPPALSKKIRSWLDEHGESVSAPATDGRPDFGPLRDHIDDVRKQRAAILLAQQSSSFSFKRSMVDDELAEQQAEKRRKKEEEDKKRKLESVGLRALKKVDTSGMKKLSAFFTAKPKAK